MGVYVVIPAYNEAKSIGKVLTELREKGYNNIIVVDDGSKDKTSGVAEKYATVLRHIINRGQGAALKTGIDFALSKNAETIVTFDADGQFLVDDIKRLRNAQKETNADIVLGSRFLGKAENIPFMKKLVLKLGILVVLILYGINVTDPQSGLRVMNRKAAKLIQIRSNKMEHAGEILHEIKNKGLKYKEAPITVIYHDYAIKRGQKWTRSIHLGFKMIYRKLVK